MSFVPYIKNRQPPQNPTQNCTNLNHFLCILENVRKKKYVWEKTYQFEFDEFSTGKNSKLLVFCVEMVNLNQK